MVKVRLISKYPLSYCVDREKVEVTADGRSGYVNLTAKADIARDKFVVESEYIEVRESVSFGKKIPSNGLKVEYTLFEGSGTTLHDTSGNEHHGTIRGCTWVKLPTGKWVLRFDGCDDYVALPYCYGKSSLKEITVCVWARSSSKQRQILVSFDRSENFRLAMKDDMTYQNVGWDTTDSDDYTHDLGTKNDYTDGKWHFICGWYKAGASPDKKIIIDCEVVATADAHSGKLLGAGKERSCTYGFIGVGSEAASFDGVKGPLYWFKGDIGLVLIYHKALSEAKIEKIYKTTAPLFGIEV